MAPRGSQRRAQPPPHSLRISTCLSDQNSEDLPISNFLKHQLVPHSPTPTPPCPGSCLGKGWLAFEMPPFYREQNQGPERGTRV